MKPMTKKAAHVSRRIRPSTLLLIVLLSTTLAGLLGFAGAVLEIWLDLENYAPEHNTLIAAIQVETQYLFRMTIAVASIGCISGILGSIIFAAWRFARSAIGNGAKTNLAA